MSCIDLGRREIYFGDTYDDFIPLPESSHQDNLTLPSFIPGIAKGLRISLPQRPNAIYAISLSKIVGCGGNVVIDSLDVLREKLGLPFGARLALVGTAKDCILEALWKVSDTDHSWEKIARLGFDFVVGLSYSVWDEQPRLDQIRNQDRNLQIHDRFANLGVPSIPFLYPFDDSDYRAVFKWLGDRPDINKVAILAQYYKKPHQFRQLLRNMRAIQDGAKRPLEFVVVGAAKQNKIAALMNEFAATVITWKPFQAALHGLRTTENLHHPPGDILRLGMSREELVTHNIERYFGRCEELRQAGSKRRRLGKELPDGKNKVA
ncbi:MAG: hypothetical protein JOZ96_11635 [Acidobacteria bacterium]|nr:hypothetical protein [Acidobacteriota bacterium]